MATNDSQKDSTRKGFFKAKSKPVSDQIAEQQEVIDEKAASQKKMSGFEMYINKMASRKKGLDMALKEQDIKSTPQQFVKRMVLYDIIVSAILFVALSALFSFLLSGTVANSLIISIVLGGLFGVVAYITLLQTFLNFPAMKNKNRGKDIERDILFAARDIVISMRSGMPLFNALAAVSVGYGASSKEFEKIVDLVQLGTPMEQAIDEVSLKSQSKTFKRLMLQASVSIRAGADVVLALQEVVNEVTQERIIDLRRYGQRLNALSMFYLLFGIIFPSMGIAVAAILTTFINIFSINDTILIIVIIFIAILQFVFLNIMRSSRPVFSL